ncbi:MAG: hypothetical protein J0J01_18700 [Reyranella sp.]|uniref:DUF6338 family protein n=1 Tax=Reyranella sp. TaxID=1929291 RepID=UPI001ACEC164|nr:DUF6338 family protein [Reyranella sp.]MBN9088941.1 hypothetical protein [Reyranella sp.]
MKFDLFIVQIAILFLPGLIWAGLDSRYALKSKPSEVQFVLRAFQFGLASYAATFGVYALLGWPFALADLADASAKGILTPSIFKEVASAIGVGLILAILWLFGSNHKWDTRFLQWIGATKTYGDEDVWDFTFNSPVAAVEYVHYRDFANQIVYAGWVKEFSESEKLRELVLRDAEIFDFDGNKLFETPLVYLARSPDNIHVEFPYRPG